MKCRAIKPTVNAACGDPATVMVTFKDGQKEPMCQACALQMQQVAQQHGSTLALDVVAPLAP